MSINNKQETSIEKLTYQVFDLCRSIYSPNLNNPNTKNKIFLGTEPSQRVSVAFSQERISIQVFVSDLFLDEVSIKKYSNSLCEIFLYVENEENVVFSVAPNIYETNLNKPIIKNELLKLFKYYTNKE